MVTPPRGRRARRIAYEDLSPQDRALIDQSRRIAAERAADPQWQGVRRLNAQVWGEDAPGRPDTPAR